ncbi:hypothetical protein [Corynebacterium sp. 321]|uniref:hypothetical protein n=1 Tax=Corynebacterium sp. 321 TaxID=2651047 RepID=UPI00130141CB|nr:hypothetical protein [Corynebacterium sp. 321]KAB1550739.1 hypothetical protein F7233_09430 [Corynebacterium sp. 321]
MNEALILGIISGVISGFLVSFSLWFADYLRRPPVELIYSGENRATLRNNRFRPVVVGGSWRPCGGSAIRRADGYRGGEGGFYIPRLGRTYVATEQFHPGETATVMYKYVRTKKDQRSILTIEKKNIMDVADAIGNPDQYPEWKYIETPLQIAA